MKWICRAHREKNCKQCETERTNEMCKDTCETKKIEWKIGNYYRTRGGEKRFLIGFRRNGHPYFESQEGSLQEYQLDGRPGSIISFGHSNQIVSEWREPHRHESFVWIRKADNETVKDDLWSKVFGLNIIGFSTNGRSYDFYPIKLRVTVEEILE